MSTLSPKELDSHHSPDVHPSLQAPAFGQFMPFFTERIPRPGGLPPRTRGPYIAVEGREGGKCKHLLAAVTRSVASL